MATDAAGPGPDRGGSSIAARSARSVVAMSSYDETQSDQSFPRPASEPDPITAPAPDESTGDEDDDPDADQDDDADPVSGDDDEGAPVGPAGVHELINCAQRVSEIGRASRSRLGDRIVGVADDLRALANDARRRLADDRLPDDAGTPDQQRRVEDEHRRRAAAADATDGEPAGR
jgi:hypothetical protein